MEKANRLKTWLNTARCRLSDEDYKLFLGGFGTQKRPSFLHFIYEDHEKNLGKSNVFVCFCHFLRVSRYFPICSYKGNPNLVLSI